MKKGLVGRIVGAHAGAVPRPPSVVSGHPRPVVEPKVREPVSPDEVGPMGPGAGLLSPRLGVAEGKTIALRANCGYRNLG